MPEKIYTMSSKTEFASKLGLIAATVGSAVGLGNIWRFPAQTQEGGGSAFLLLYMACVFLLGIPAMLAEFSLGRGTKSDAISSFKVYTPKRPWWLVGYLGVVASLAIIAFYTVVEGWTLEYLYESITGNLFDGVGTTHKETFFTGKMAEYINTDSRLIIFVIVCVAVNALVLLGGVQKGIERLSNWLMPVLFVFLLILMCVSLSLPNAIEGVVYFLQPDFSKINAEVVFGALGQAFFSLSLGILCLVTYASYYPKDTKMPQVSMIVVLSSVLVAVMVGLVIFPAVKSFGLDSGSLEGATLVFVTLPDIFSRLPFPQLWAVLFFVLLAVAAITSCVSIAEVPIAVLQDHFKMSRTKAVLIVLIPMMFVSMVTALSFGSLSDLTFFGMTLFDIFDFVSANILLPFISLLVCIYVGWVLPKNFFKDEVSNHGMLRTPLGNISVCLVRYFVPFLTAIVLVYGLL